MKKRGKIKVFEEVLDSFFSSSEGFEYIAATAIPTTSIKSIIPQNKRLSSVFLGSGFCSGGGGLLTVIVALVESKGGKEGCISPRI